MEDTLRHELQRYLGGRRFKPGSGDHIGMAWPRTVADVQQLALLTRDANVAVIPRAATSNPFSRVGTNGLAVSFDQLARVRSINMRSRRVTVEPGVIWHTLIEHLAAEGLMPRMYPSSEGFTTVGGFVAQGGAGIGSYEFGDISRSVTAVRLVDANGELHHIKGDDLQLVIGAEGRTGLVVDVTLQLQELTPMVPAVGLFSSLQQAERCLERVVAQGLPLWSVHLMGPIGAGVQSRQWPQFALPEGEHPTLYSFRERDGHVVTPALQDCIREAAGRWFEVHGEAEEWLIQFASLQAEGTTPIPMQFQLPLGHAAEFMASVQSELWHSLAKEAVVTDLDGTKAVVVRLFFAERGVNVEDNRAAARELLALAQAAGGRIYATGAAYPEHAEAVFGPDRLKAMTDFRRTVDPDNRLNPGHAFP